MEIEGFKVGIEFGKLSQILVLKLVFDLYWHHLIFLYYLSL